MRNRTCHQSGKLNQKDANSVKQLSKQTLLYVYKRVKHMQYSDLHAIAAAEYLKFVGCRDSLQCRHIKRGDQDLSVRYRPE